MPIRDWMHGVGKPVSGIDPLEDAKAVGLDWEVKKSPRGLTEDGEPIINPKDKLNWVYRSDTNEAIDACRSREPWQNVDVISHFYKYCQEEGFKVEALGYLPDKHEILVGASVPITSNIKNCGDITEYKFLMRHSHRTGTALNNSLYKNRQICTNGINVILNNVTCRAVHSTTFDLNKDKITQSWEKVIAVIEKSEETYNALADVQMDKETATLHLITAFGDLKDFLETKSVDRQPRVVQACLRLFLGEATGSDYISAYNTAYGLLQAVTEYYNWGGAIRKNTTAFSSILDSTSNSRGGKMLNFEQQLVSAHIR